MVMSTMQPILLLEMDSKENMTEVIKMMVGVELIYSVPMEFGSFCNINGGGFPARLCL